MLKIMMMSFLKLCMLFASFSLLSVSGQGSRGAGLGREVMFSKNNVMNKSPPTFFVSRAGEEERCSTDAIEIEQGPTTTLPSGIPTYTVEIVNVCVSGCSISDIHLSCGWFSSAVLVDPNIFKRISFDDCLVNAGQPLAAGQSLSFQYANTRSYPLSVSSLAC